MLATCGTVGAISREQFRRNGGIMFGNFFSKIAGALQRGAMERPTHFPAVNSANDAKEEGTETAPAKPKQSDDKPD